MDKQTKSGQTNKKRSNRQTDMVVGLFPNIYLQSCVPGSIEKFHQHKKFEIYLNVWSGLLS